MDSDVGELSRRRPFNCAAAFEASSSSSNALGSSSDAYLYSDPEMSSTGWQDSGRRSQYKSGANNSSSNNNNNGNANTTEQTSSITVVSAPGTSSMRASDIDAHSEKKSGDSSNLVRVFMLILLLLNLIQ